MITLTHATPLAVLAGDTLTLTGTGFDPDTPAAHPVTLGGLPAAVTAVTATTLQVTVPDGVQAGPVDVRASADAGATWATLPRGVYLLITPAVSTAANLVQGSARAVFIDGRPVGYTDQPVRLTHDVTLAEAEVEQEMGAVQLFKRGERWRLFLSLGEVSLENLRLAFAGTTITTAEGQRVTAVGGTSVVDEHSVLVQGPGPGGTARDFYAYRAVIEERAPLVIARDKPQQLALTFRLLPDLALPAGQRVLRIAETEA